jgi:hypothetical protein
LLIFIFISFAENGGICSSEEEIAEVKHFGRGRGRISNN